MSPSCRTPGDHRSFHCLYSFAFFIISQFESYCLVCLASCISLKHSPYTVLKCPGVQRLLVLPSHSAFGKLTVLGNSICKKLFSTLDHKFPELLWIILFPRIREEVWDGGEKSQMCASDPVLSKAGGELISYPGKSPGNPTRQPQMYPVWGEGIRGQGGDYKIN